MTTKKKGRPDKGRRSHASKQQTKIREKKTTPAKLTRASAAKLMAADLKQSNLTMADGKKRGFKLQSPEHTQKRTKTAKYRGAYIWSYLIPYYDINGKCVKNYWRVRYLEEVAGKYGSKPTRPRRYTGPQDARIRIYFDPTCDYSEVRGAS